MGKLIKLPINKEIGVVTTPSRTFESAIKKCERLTKRHEKQAHVKIRFDAYHFVKERTGWILYADGTAEFA